MPFALIPRAWQGQVPNQLLTTTRKKGREGGVGVECSSCRWALAHALRAGLSTPWNRALHPGQDSLVSQALG